MKKIITLTFLAILGFFSSNAQCTILGSLGACVGGSIYLSVDSTGLLCAGGTWSSSNPAIATVAGSGYVTGIAAGMATISYVSGGGLSTVVVTVNPSPAAISGPSTFCAGASATYTDATPGGTWSCTPSYVATINPATGVATGVSGGYASITYSMPGGCGVSTSVTVGSTTLYDSISGPTSLCSGATGTLTSSISGGVWSSSTVTVATINPTTGVVTGVSTGSTTITYTVTGACGAASDYYTINVNPTITAGSILGTTTAMVGATSGLYCYPTGGTWASSMPSVATVDATGTVTGVSIGTTNIQYVVNGCINSDTAYATFTVTSADGISGNVMFGAAYYGYVQVWLITFNPSTLDLEAADSTSLYCSGTSVHYSFTGLATDSFRVKAATIDSATLTSGYIPTYHDSSYHWNSASVIYHTSGTSDINENIHMHTGTTTSGPGFISGNVTSGADKGTSGGTPVVGMLIYVVNSTTGAQLQQTYTDVSGNYTFTNLPVGATYLIYPEAINYATTVYSSITLTTGAPSLAAADFKQHTISKTITPIYTKVNNITPSLSSVCVFPNPTSGKLNLQWNETATEKGTLVVTDMTGKVLMTNTVEMTSGNGAAQIDLSNLANGMYMVSIQSSSISYSNKITVRKD